jgi:hypothetical protein
MTTTIKPGDPCWVNDHNVRPGNWRTDVVKSVGPKWITLQARGERFSREVSNADRGTHRGAPNLVGVAGAVFSEEDYLNCRFIDEKRHAIANRVSRCQNADLLREIDTLITASEKENP